MDKIFLLMSRAVTLFTGQWADLPLAKLLPLVKKMGYDGVELACWGDHFEVDRALAEPDYCKKKWAFLAKHGLKCFAISAHLVGQAVCDLIDERHQAILPAEVWGDGKSEGVRQRAAEKMKATAKAARKFFDAKPSAKKGEVAVVNGFTGSSIWHSLYGFPPTNQDFWNKGYADFAKRWTPILDEFDKHNVNFALEVHPTEIAFDIASAQRALAAVKNHPRFGFNYDPSHLGYQGVNYVTRAVSGISVRSAMVTSTSRKSSLPSMTSAIAARFLWNGKTAAWIASTVQWRVARSSAN